MCINFSDNSNVLPFHSEMTAWVRAPTIDMIHVVMIATIAVVDTIRIVMAITLVVSLQDFEFNSIFLFLLNIL